MTNILGRTGYEVSALGYGTMELGKLDEASAVKILNQTLDEGINYIDTSPEYAMAEYYIGKAIAGRRDEYVLATKCGDNMTGIGPYYIFDRKTILANIDESLRLMKTDHVDILQLHGVVPEYFKGDEFEDVLDCLRGIRDAGKALHLGLSVCNRAPGDFGFPAGHGYNSILRFAPYPDIEVIQIVYGAMTRLSEKVIQEAKDRYDTGVVARGSIKKYDPQVYTERLKVAKLYELCEEGESETDFLIRYTMSHPGVAVSLIGTKNVEHLIENAKVGRKEALSPEIYAEAKRRLNFVGSVAGDAELAWHKK